MIAVSRMTTRTNTIRAAKITGAMAILKGEVLVADLEFCCGKAAKPAEPGKANAFTNKGVFFLHIPNG